MSHSGSQKAIREFVHKSISNLLSSTKIIASVFFLSGPQSPRWGTNAEWAQRHSQEIPYSLTCTILTINICKIHSAKSHLCPDPYDNLKTLWLPDYSNHSKQVYPTFRLCCSLSWCQCCLSHIIYTSFQTFFLLHLEQCSNNPHLELLNVTVTQIMINTTATRVARKTRANLI